MTSDISLSPPSHGLLAARDPRAIPIRVVEPGHPGDSGAAGFRGLAGETAILPDRAGGVREVLFASGAEDGVMALRALPPRLPAATYRFVAPDSGDWPASAVALAWALGGYRFDRYRTRPAAGAEGPRLATGLGDRLGEVTAVADACVLARDLVNTPANDMGPAEIEAAARAAAARWGGEVSAIQGEALIEAGYPLVHAVGRAAARGREPRLVEIVWGEPDAPRIALIGKGVAFDSGGLDLKAAAGMRLMKKDMGGAAHALALAGLIAGARLPVRLVLLIPAVENAVAGEAIRPGDVITSRAGLTVEIGNTDAEGRLILADALTRAGEFEPALTVDLATLTGAARVALGPQVAPFYTADDRTAAELAAAGAAVEDPVWRMPLWGPYAAALESDIADIRNDADPWAQAGSIAAALFLERFVPKNGTWVHFDIFAWNARGRPGFPVGAEAQGIRALWSVIQARFG